MSKTTTARRDGNTLSGGLQSACAAHATAPFLLTAARDWTYGEIEEAVAQLASAILATGVHRGERIAIAAPNSAEWVITWFAAARIGCPLVTLNVAY